MELLTTGQAAHRLGIKPETLYAYVSRGLLPRHRGPDGRRSRFAAADVERLARRGRPRQASRSPTFELDVATAVTEVGDHRVAYRGHDVVRLAGTTAFEQVAELLWTGALPARAPAWPSDPLPTPTTWTDPTTRTETDDASAGRLGARLRTAVALHAEQAAAVTVESTPRQAAGETVTGEQLVASGRRLLASMVDALPIRSARRGTPRLRLTDGATVTGSIAGRLWVRLTARRADPPTVAALNAALVLLADHEMAASTLTARIAASTRARAHEVVAAGAATVSGPLHGGHSARVRTLLTDARERSPDAAIDAAIERWGRLPGHGHVLYPDGDPRAVALLAALRAAPAAGAVLDLVDQLSMARRRRDLPPPNVDLALAALGEAGAMPDDAGEAIFTVARTSGWIAHAAEELDERPLRYRPRATYVGPPRRDPPPDPRPDPSRDPAPRGAHR